MYDRIDHFHIIQSGVCFCTLWIVAAVSSAISKARASIDINHEQLPCFIFQDINSNQIQYVQLGANIIDKIFQLYLFRTANGEVLRFL